MGKRKWTDPAKEIIHSMWGTYPPNKIAHYIKRHTGLVFTPEAVRQKAQDEGLDYRDAQGDLTISDAARDIGIPQATLWKALKREGIETYGKAMGRFIRQEDMPRVRALYPPPPEPTIDTPDAAKRLKISKEALTGHIRRGNLQAYWYKRQWRVSARDLERFYWDRIKNRK